MDSIRVDLHCHTHRSPDCLMRPDRLLQVCRRRGIDRIAITDHNSIRGALEAAELDPDRVIIGEEVMTTQGELLGYFLVEEVPAGLPPEQAIERLRQQGALISVSHPIDPLRGGAWELEDLRRIMPLVDALEVFNARSMRPAPNQVAADLAREAGLLGTAGSDAHAYLEVGRAGLQLPPFEDPASMRQSLEQAQVIERLSSPLVHFLSRYAAFRKKLARRRA